MEVKTIIKQKGFTMESVAKKMGITRVTLAQNLSRNPTVGTLQKIADVIGCKVGDFFVDDMDIKDDEFKDIFIGEQADFDIKFVREYISPDAPYGKERIGYIVDRVGYKE